MLQKTDRFRLGWKLFFSFLALSLFYPYLMNLYALDIKDTHLIYDRNPQYFAKQAFLQGKDTGGKSGGRKFGVNVDLVMMYTSVFDKNGHFISGLEKKDFNVYEDGVRQEIASFSREDVPVSMGIILDLSGSMEKKIDRINSAAGAFIQASNPQDEVFLVGFNDEVELLQEFTSDIDEITDALDNAVVMGGTALYDAVYLGVEEARKGKKEKKAIVVITDGEDLDSAYTLNELIASVQEADVQIFSVGFLNELPDKGIFGGLFKKSAVEKARDALERISGETGGKAFFPEDVSVIHRIVAEIAHELRNQYSIGYLSSNTERDGSWRRVVIRLDNGIAEDPQLRYRRGYYAPKN
ncbi:MAG: VWA domain-containing protein [Acidobacteria bacterium]|nr:VWA domain-containing protein [Acidobacteriota bacterium]